MTKTRKALSILIFALVSALSLGVVGASSYFGSNGAWMLSKPLGRVLFVVAGSSCPVGPNGSQGCPYATISAAYAAIPAADYGGAGWTIKASGEFTETLNLTRTDATDLTLTIERDRGPGLSALTGNVVYDADHILQLVFHNFPITGDVRATTTSATPTGTLSFSTDYAERFRALTGDIIGAPKYSVEEATNAMPIVCKVTGHPYLTGDRVQISKGTGNTAVNKALWVVTKIDADHFSLDASVGSGVYDAGTAKVVGLTYPRASKLMQLELGKLQHSGHILLPYTTLVANGLLKDESPYADVEVNGSIDMVGIRDSIFTNCRFRWGYPSSGQPEGIDTWFQSCTFQPGCTMDAESGSPGQVRFDPISYRSYTSGANTFSATMFPQVQGNEAWIPGAALTNANVTISLTGVGATSGFTRGGNYYELSASTTAERTATLNASTYLGQRGGGGVLRVRVSTVQAYQYLVANNGAANVFIFPLGTTGYVDLLHIGIVADIDQWLIVGSSLVYGAVTSTSPGIVPAGSLITPAGGRIILGGSLTQLPASTDVTIAAGSTGNLLTATYTTAGSSHLLVRGVVNMLLDGAAGSGRADCQFRLDNSTVVTKSYHSIGCNGSTYGHPGSMIADTGTLSAGSHTIDYRCTAPGSGQIRVGTASFPNNSDVSIELEEIQN